MLHQDKLPLSIRVLLEAAIRNCDGFYIKEEDVQNIMDWQQQQDKAEVPFSPARVLLQDFTSVSLIFKILFFVICACLIQRKQNEWILEICITQLNNMNFLIRASYIFLSYANENQLQVIQVDYP